MSLLPTAKGIAFPHPLLKALPRAVMGWEKGHLATWNFSRAAVSPQHQGRKINLYNSKSEHQRFVHYQSYQPDSWISYGLFALRKYGRSNFSVGSNKPSDERMP